MKRFFRYTLVGCGNTLIHWLIFFGALQLTNSQALSNLFGFLVAASTSFVINAKFTFQSNISRKKYFQFLGGMAAISFGTGLAADINSVQPLLTLVAFSIISLGAGFAYSNYFIFRSKLPSSR